VTPQIRFAPLPNTYKLIVALAERVYPDYSDDTLTPSSWSCFLKALGVRNRLTHPKNLSDLQVSRKDSNFCYAAFLRVLALAIDILHLDRQTAWAEINKIQPTDNHFNGKGASSNQRHELTMLIESNTNALVLIMRIFKPNIKIQRTET
jgi:hypothetical protein